MSAHAVFGLIALNMWFFGVGVAVLFGVRGWASFRLPETLDYQRLVATERPNPALPEERVGPAERRRRRWASRR